MIEVTHDQITWYRMKRSGFIDPFDSPENCARELGGVQAQIHSAAGLSLWNRCKEFNFRQFEDKLYDERSLVKLWGQRGTLHVYPSWDWPLIIGSRRNRPTWSERSMVKMRGDSERFHAIIDIVRDIVREEGIVSRSRLRELDIDWDVGVDVDLLSSWGGIFSQLVIEGSACPVKPEKGEGRFAHRNTWLPELEWNPPTFEEANIELARRYLHTFGPATSQDFAYWRGIPLKDARVAFSALEPKAGNDVNAIGVVNVVKALKVTGVGRIGNELLILEKDLDTLLESTPPRSKWPVKLLYRFDPILLGHKDKSWIIDRKHYDKVWVTAGHINGTILVRGNIQGTWKYKRKGKSLEITIEPFRRFGKRLMRKVEQEAEGAAKFFGFDKHQVTIQKTEKPQPNPYSDLSC